MNGHPDIAAATYISSDSDVGKPSQWVTKSQIRQYEMCAYTYWLLYARQITPAEVFGGFEELIVASGSDFEAELIADLPEVPDNATLEELAKTAQFIFNVQTIANEARKIAGRPDGIELSTFAPIEVKRHNKVTPMDRLELAFYWLLLEGQRQDQSLTPYGWICRPCFPEPTRVNLTRRDFARVEYLINAVRVAREHGVKPRVCYCHVCYQRPEVVELYERKQDVRLIWGVGPQNSRLLEEAGIASLHSLVEADPIQLTDTLKTMTGRRFSTDQVASWSHHARAIVENRPVRFADHRLESDEFIVLDLEYDVMMPGSIWLIGLQVVSNSRPQVLQLWCDGRSGVRKSLKKMGQLLSDYRDLPILTWNGTGADIPQIQYALTPSLRMLADEVRSRHIDFYHIVRKSMRFPTTALSLKAVTDYAGIQRKSKISDGLEALVLYHRYCDSSSERARQKYKSQLLTYNMDDLVAIPELVRFCNSVSIA